MGHIDLTGYRDPKIRAPRGSYCSVGSCWSGWGWFLEYYAFGAERPTPHQNSSLETEGRNGQQKEQPLAAVGRVFSEGHLPPHSGP